VNAVDPEGLLEIKPNERWNPVSGDHRSPGVKKFDKFFGAGAKLGIGQLLPASPLGLLSRYGPWASGIGGAILGVLTPSPLADGTLSGNGFMPCN
jgi:hypothetical protein